MSEKNTDRVEFTETSPGVWQTATPGDAEKLDAQIDAALAGMGTSLAELREAVGEGDTETLPDDHKRALSFVFTVAEFRELMRAAMYRADDLAATDYATADVLRSAASKLGDAWNAAEEDQTPTVCAAPECGRTRPRWTMERVGGAWVCSPKNAMSCGVCCKRGEYLTHYTEEEHQHQPETPEENATCSRCGRDRPLSALARKAERAGGGLACRPDWLEEYDACMRIFNTV